jgi:hypothetical protein
MDPQFSTIFARRLDLLSQTDPFSWIRSLLGDIATRHLNPQGMTLRPDGELFLLTNIGELIVIPWDGRYGQGNFKNLHFTLLTNDMDRILADSVPLTRQKGALEVTARTLLETTARMTVPLATFALNIWGP